MTTEPNKVVVRAKPKQVLALAKCSKEFFATKPTIFVCETKVAKLF